MLKVKNVVIGEGSPKICLPITGRSIEEIEEQAMQINEKAPDLVEWRADFYSELEVEEPLRVIRKHIADLPIIFTFRTQKEGGEKEIADQDYLSINEKAMMSGFIDLIDIELKQPIGIRDPLIAKAKQQGIHTIISNHDFDKTPAKEEMINRLKEAELVGASIAKLAVMPKDSNDVLNLLSITDKMSKIINIPLITISMGGLGLITRFTGEIFGSAVTFGTAGQLSAPGQIDNHNLSMVLETIHQNLTK